MSPAQTVEFGSLLAFEAESVIDGPMQQPLNRLSTGQEVERASRNGPASSMLADFSGGLLPGVETRNYLQTFNRYAKNLHGIQCRHPGLAVLPYVVKNQATTSGPGASGLVAYWPLDEASGNAIDAHGSNDLTETGGTIGTAAGNNGDARDLERGDTEYFVGADAAWNSITGDMTICGWFNMESLPSSTGRSYGLFTKWNNPNESYQLRVTTSDTIRFGCSSTGNGQTNVGTTVATTGAWIFVCARHRNGATIDISVNAGSPESAAFTGGIFDGTTALYLGSYAGAPDLDNFDGLLQHFGLWNRALTDAEVAWLYNSGTGRSYTEVSAVDADISGYNAANKRVHGVMSSVGSSSGSRFYAGLGPQLLRANVTTFELEIAHTFTNNITCISELNVNGSMVLAVATDGDTDDIRYTSDPTASEISWTLLVALSSGDWVSAMRYLPTVGPGFNVMVGKIAGTTGVWWQDNATAATWTMTLVVDAATIDQSNANATVENTGAISPTTGYSVHVNGVTTAANLWATPTAITASDDSKATTPNATANMSHFLIGVFDFRALVPAVCDIIGVAAAIERMESDAGINAADEAVVLVNNITADKVSLAAGFGSGIFQGNFTVLTTNKAVSTEWPTSDATANYGGSTDLWGSGDLSATVVRDPGFGLALAVDTTSVASNNARVDHMTLTVYFRRKGAPLASGSGGGGGAGIGIGGWMLNRNPAFPNRLTLVAPDADETATILKPRELWHLDFAYDPEGERPVGSISQPNEGMGYVHDAVPYQGGWVIVGSQKAGMGTFVKFLDGSGNLLNFGWFGHNGTSICKINTAFTQGDWLILDTVSVNTSDTVTDRQWVLYKDGAWHLDTQSQSITGANSDALDIAAQPIAWGTRTINLRDNRIYSIFPNSTDTAVARQFLPPDLAKDPRLVDTTEVKAMASVSTGEDTAAYLETPRWAMGPQEANLKLLTAQYIDRLVDSGTSYGTVALSYSVDNGSNFTSLTAFSAAFQKRYFGTATSGVQYRDVIFRLALSHTADSALTPNALPIVLNTDQSWPPLRTWIVTVKASELKPTPLKWFQAWKTLVDASGPTHKLQIGVVRDTASSTGLGAAAQLKDYRPVTPVKAPILGQENSAADLSEIRYQFTFEERDADAA